MASMSSPTGRTMRFLSNGTLIIIGVLFVLPLIWILLASFDANNTLAIEVPKVLMLSNF